MDLLSSFNLSLFFITVISVISCAQKNVIVTTNLGKIRGNILKSRLGQRFYAFRGIPYAEPPTGELRFQAPVPVQSWNGIHDATQDGPMCPQEVRYGNPLDMTEDCLFLNVYTKEAPEISQTNAKKPVIVYIHPGGYYSLSGQSKNNAGPQLLMDRDIVLVTMNYRLGSLGFLATGTRDAPGNAGLKDQATALRWVKDNIERFGGDRNSVTLMGYDAGGMSVTLHMVSPMSRGLFHKAIVMSGSAIAHWKTPTEQIEIAKRQARLINCRDDNVLEMVQCLKVRSPEKYIDTAADMFDFQSGIPALIWTPVVELNFGQERFLVEDPTKSFQNGNFMRVPVITGITKDEYVWRAIGILENSTRLQHMENYFDDCAAICFFYERDSSKTHKISQELRKKFLGTQALDKTKSIRGLGNLFSDSLVGFGVHRFVHLAARYTKIYYYRFTYQGRYSHYNYRGGKPYGVVHRDDLLYLFGIRDIAPLFTQNDPEHITVERLTRMWTNFATNGDPNRPGDEYLQGIDWKSFNLREENYLDINSKLVMKKGLYLGRYSYWKKLFPLNWDPRQTLDIYSENEEFNEDYPFV